MRTNQGVLIATVATVGGTAVIMKALFSITGVAVWLAMTVVKVVILLILVVVIGVILYFTLKRRSKGLR